MSAIPASLSTTEEPLVVLVVDDDPTNLLVVERLLAPLQCRVITATNGDEALKQVQQEHPDVILLDVMMPGLNGFEVCRRLKSDTHTRLIPIIITTALQEKKDRIMGIEAGCDDFISKPIDRHELIARVQALGRVKRLNDDLVHAEEILMTLARAVESKDGTTGSHCDRLIEITRAFGKHLGLEPAALKTLERASVLHDVGKIGIPDSVLLKPGKLNDEEWAVMRRHPALGEEICRPLRSLKDVLPIIRHHHEKWNGSGYPDGLSGTEIPYLARVFQIVDAFEAMTTTRPYKLAFSTDEALRLLEEEGQRGLWDPSILRSFLEFVHTTGENYQ